MALGVVYRAPASLRRSLHNTSAVPEPRPEQDVRVREQALFQTDHNELRSLEAVLEQLPDVLRVREVEGSVDLVENIHWRGFELEEGHDQR
jgi:hypothetical protein